MVADGPQSRLVEIYRNRARKAALAELLKPIGGRERDFYPCIDSAMVLDDGGGSCITLFEDWEACHYFLIWLQAKRAQRMSGGEA